MNKQLFAALCLALCLTMMVPAAKGQAPDPDASAVSDTPDLPQPPRKAGLRRVRSCGQGRHAPFRRGLRPGRPGASCALGPPARSPTSARSPSSSRPRPSSRWRRAGSFASPTPSRKYFDGVPADKAAITLHHLLTHSSGLSDPDIDDFDPVPLAEYRHADLRQAAPVRPGNGLLLLQRQFQPPRAPSSRSSPASPTRPFRQGAAVPAARDVRNGLHLPRLGREPLRARAMDAAGGAGARSSSAPRPPTVPHWALRANGGIHTTVYDMLRWARALLEGRVLSPASMNKLWTPHVERGRRHLLRLRLVDHERAGRDEGRHPQRRQRHLFRRPGHRAGHGHRRLPHDQRHRPKPVGELAPAAARDALPRGRALSFDPGGRRAGRRGPQGPPRDLSAAGQGRGVCRDPGRGAALHRGGGPRGVRSPQFRPRRRAREDRDSQRARGPDDRREHERRFLDPPQGLRRRGQDRAP